MKRSEAAARRRRVLMRSSVVSVQVAKRLVFVMSRQYARSGRGVR